MDRPVPRAVHAQRVPLRRLTQGRTPCTCIEPIVVAAGSPGVTDRRRFLRRAGKGFGMLALADLLGGDRLLVGAVQRRSSITEADAFSGDGPLRDLAVHGRRPGAMDTFDPKPELSRHHGQRPGRSIDVFFGSPGPLMRSPFGFRQHGQSGAWVCDRLPHLAGTSTTSP